MKVYERVAQTLKTAGVDTVFGLMGDANLFVAISYMEDQGGRFVTTLDEGGAVSMADGYARSTGGIGVASVTHGPGASNCITALTEAVRARSHVVLLTGDTPSTPDHLQRFDLRAAAELAGADYVRILSADTVAEQIWQALATLVATSRPVLVDVPVDLLAAESGLEVRPRDLNTPVSVPGGADLDKALGILANARRPVVLAGRGAALAGAHDELIALADATGAVLATSLLARGFFSGDPYDVGVLGGIGHPAATEVALDSDCIVAFGAGLNRFTTADGALLRGRRILQVDNQRAAIGRLAAPDVALVGDARATAGLMVEMLTEVGHRSTTWRERRLKDVSLDQPLTDDFAGSGASDMIDLRAAMLVLDEQLPRDRLVVTDTGRFIYPTWRYLTVQDPLHFAHTLNFASIGLGLATAIGVATAHPDKLTVVVAGDGGGMMGMGELTTAVRERLPLLVVIANDSAYGMEHRTLVRAGRDPKHSKLTWPAFTEVARGYGVEAHRVHDEASLRRVLAQLNHVPTGPVLIELLVDPDVDVGE